MKKLREYLFNNCVMREMDVFERGDKVFNGEWVLEERIIIKIGKRKNRGN